MSYLWLGTFSPALLYQQMSEAYKRGIRKMWILNVGDIKPAEYQTELFLDMAWNMDNVRSKGVSGHLCDFLKREFGDRLGDCLLPVMEEHYHLAFIRKPEFLGNTRTEEYGTDKYKHVRDLQWSDSYIIDRLNTYAQLSDAVERHGSEVATNRRDTYFQLIKYPVQASCEMNKKMLYAQLARHGRNCMDKSIAAFDSICVLTSAYNHGITNNGKWNGIMDYKPRNLPVFEPIIEVVPARSIEDKPVLLSLAGADCVAGTPVVHRNLGHSRKAAEILRHESLCYGFDRDMTTDSLSLTFKLLPNHPKNAADGLKFSVSLDECTPVIIDYTTFGRSEEWKENVLNNQAIRTVTMPVSDRTSHTLKVTAMTDGIILDAIEINNRH